LSSLILLTTHTGRGTIFPLEGWLGEEEKQFCILV